MHTRFWSENLKRRNHFDGLNVVGRIILEWILGKYSVRAWTGLIWLRMCTVVFLL
jgi:hypothetical protein